MYDQDKEFQDETIKSIKIYENKNAFEITFVEGMGLYVRNPNNKPLPVEGDTVRLYGKGLGYAIRGVYLPDKEITYYYDTSDEYERSQVNRRKQEQAANQVLWDNAQSRVNDLPAQFRERIQGFTSYSPTWGSDFGMYELMVLEQATTMANRFKTEEALEEFRCMSFKDQSEAFPDLDEDHSGNSMGASIAMAKMYLSSPSHLVKAHGALCPMVGCKNYGCYSVRNKK